MLSSINILAAHLYCVVCVGEQKLKPWANLSIVCKRGVDIVEHAAEPAVEPWPGPMIGLEGE